MMVTTMTTMMMMMMMVMMMLTRDDEKLAKEGKEDQERLYQVNCNYKVTRHLKVNYFAARLAQ